MRVELILFVEEKDLKEFIIKYLKLFTTKTKKQISEIKRVKDKFWRRKEIKSKIPKNSKVAKEVVNYLIKTNKINNQENLNKLISISPYIDKYLFNKNLDDIISETDENLEESFPETFLSSEELHLLKRKEFLEKKIEDRTKIYQEDIKSHYDRQIRAVKQEVETEKAELRKKTEEFQEKKKEFEVISELDIFKDLEINEEFVLDKVSRPVLDESEIEWYSRLRLIRDPFPSTFGLINIEEKYYDEIVIKTAIFTNFLKLFTQDQNNFFNKSYILCGEYGCGKTTFFDYFKRILIANYVFPIHIFLDSERQLEWVKTNFYREIYDKLATELEKREFIQLQSIKEQNLSRYEIGILINELLKAGHYKSVIIFIDGLHKDDGYRKTSYEFLAHLQNFHEDLIRKGVNIGFFVAGSNYWYNELRKNPRISASFYSFVKFPSVSSDQAHEMFSKRFQAFSIDKSSPVQIYKAEIEDIFKNLSKKFSRDITFRDYIDEIIPKLKISNLTIIHLPEEIEPEILTKIIETFFSNPKIKEQFRQVEELCKNDRNALFSILNLIKDINQKKIVSESSSLFQKNKESFFLLSKLEIVKKLIQDKESLNWVLNSALTNIINEIMKNYKISFKKYVFKLLNLELSKEEGDRLPSEIILNFKKILNFKHDIIKELTDELEASLKTYKHVDDVLKGKTYYRFNKEPLKIIRELLESLDPLLRVMFEISGDPLDIRSTNRDRLFFIFSRTWMATEDFTKFRQQYKQVVNYKKITETDLLELYRDYFRAFPSIIKKIIEMDHFNPYLKIGSSYLNNYEKSKLELIRKKFHFHQYIECVNELWDLIEIKSREIIFLILYVHFGKKWNKKLPTIIQKYIKDQKDKKKIIKYYDTYPKEENLLYYTNRFHIPMILLNNELWRLVFSHIFGPNTKKSLQTFFENLHHLAVNAKHNTPKEFWISNNEKLFVVIKESKPFLEVLTQSASILFSDNEHLIDEDNKMYCSCNPLNKNEFFPFYLNTKELKQSAYKISKKLLNEIYENKTLPLKILDINEIYRRFQCDYRSFFFVLFKILSQSFLILTEDIHGKIRLKINKDKEEEISKYIKKE